MACDRVRIHFRLRHDTATMAGYASIGAKILNGALIEERFMVKRPVIPVIPTILAAVISAAPALADAHPPLPPDTVQLSLSAEGWVEAGAAHVRMAESAPSPSPLGVAEHVELSANVVLAAEPPKSKSE